MPLILAIESDRRQAARISSLARERLNVELLVVDSAQRALQTLAERTPDLILTPHLLSPKDEAALDGRLRELDAAGLHVQTLMIPVLASSGRRGKKDGGLLNRLRRSKSDGASEGGCDPAVFAAQIEEYLERAAEERATLAAIAEDKRLNAEDNRVHQAVEPAFFESRQRFEEPAPAVADAPATILVDEPTPMHAVAEFASSVLNEPLTTFAAAEFEEPAHYQASPTPAYDEPSPTPVYYVPSPALAVSAFEEPALYQPSPIFSRPVAEAPAFDEPASALATPDLSAGFDDFVEFDELTIVDAPSVALGELTAAVERMERIEAEGLDAASVLDGLEILADPEIPAAFDMPSEERHEPRRRPAAPELRLGLASAVDPEPESSGSDFDFERDLWMPLPLAARRRWPALQGPTVKAILAPAFDAPPDADVEFAPAPDPDDRPVVRKRSKSGKPFQDEWGFFDPVQCGFAALLAKLDEVTDKDDPPSEPPRKR
jgi:CheY-like chemotaxis protein